MKGFIKIAAATLAAAAVMHGCAPKDEIMMLVGTYTTPAESGEAAEGIYTYSFDQNSGEALLKAVTPTDNPSYLTVSGDRVYVVNENYGESAAVSAYSLDEKTGELHLLSREKTDGADPCHVSDNGRIVLSANYSGGSMTVFPVKEDGAVGPYVQLLAGHSGGPDLSRQKRPHVHCAVFSPDGRYVFASDFSADAIMRYGISEADTLRYEKSFALDPDYGPRHIIFDASGRHVYVIGELSGDVTVLDYDEGELHPVQVVSADDVDARGGADIHISPDGKYLYASCRLKNDGIAIFSVNPSDGTLTRIGYCNTGIHPRNFAITPNGKYLLCACRDSGKIQVYRIGKDGMLTDTGRDILLPKPVCIQFR